MIGAMSMISSPGRAERRPSTTPAGTLESSTPMRLPRIVARRSSVDSTSRRRRCGAEWTPSYQLGRDDLISERLLEKGAKHVIGHQRRPARLEEQQRTRLD